MITKSDFARLDRQVAKAQPFLTAGAAGFSVEAAGSVVSDFTPCSNVNDAILLLAGTMDCEGWVSCKMKDSTHTFIIESQGIAIAWLHVK